MTLDVFHTKSNKIQKLISLNYLFFPTFARQQVGRERDFTRLLGGDYARGIPCLPFNHVRRRAAEQKVSVEQTPAM